MKLLAHFYEGKCTCYFRACKSIPRKRKNFKRLYIFFKKLLILLSGLQAQIHSRFDVLDPWVTSMHRVISIQWEQTISNRDFLLVFSLDPLFSCVPWSGQEYGQGSWEICLQPLKILASLAVGSSPVLWVLLPSRADGTACTCDSAQSQAV